MRDKFVPYNCSKEGRWVDKPMTSKERLIFLSRLAQRTLRIEQERAARFAAESARQLRRIHERRNQSKIDDGWTPPRINDISRRRQSEE